MQNFRYRNRLVTASSRAQAIRKIIASEKSPTTAVKDAMASAARGNDGKFVIVSHGLTAHILLTDELESDVTITVGLPIGNGLNEPLAKRYSVSDGKFGRGSSGLLRRDEALLKRMLSNTGDRFSEERRERPEDDMWWTVGGRKLPALVVQVYYGDTHDMCDDPSTVGRDYRRLVEGSLDSAMARLADEAAEASGRPSSKPLEEQPVWYVLVGGIGVHEHPVTKAKADRIAERLRAQGEEDVSVSCDADA